jgi:hypothetical protein
VTGANSGKKPESRTSNEPAREDWQRYGLSHRQVDADAPDPEEPVRPIRPEDLRIGAEDDLFLEYRHENGAHSGKPEWTPSGRRFSTNVVTASIVGALAAVLAILAIVTSGPMAVSSPTPRATQPAFVVASVDPSAAATSKAAHVGLLITLPSTITNVDRGLPLSDATHLYLTNSDGGVAIDTATGAVQNVYGGAAFGSGVERSLEQNGLWVSNWAVANSTCGPECWQSATTFRIDPTSGSVTNTFKKTYLIGSTTDGVWVAAGRQVELLDPATGHVLSNTPWTGTGEPRVGCDSLWSLDMSGNGPILAKVDAQSGSLSTGTTLDPNLTYGPITAESQCWMMNGQGGAEHGSLSLAQLRNDGSVQSSFQYPNDSVAVLDKEFWLYMPNGLIRRFDANSGTGYGTPYVLPVRPFDDDPKWFFAAAGALWLIQDGQLTGLDVPTGTTKVNG